MATREEMQKDVKVIRGDTLGASIDMKLREGDQIITGPDSRVVLRFKNDYEVYLGPNTDVTIDNPLILLKIGKIFITALKKRRERKKALSVTVKDRVNILSKYTEFFLTVNVDSITVGVVEGVVTVKPIQNGLETDSVMLGRLEQGTIREGILDNTRTMQPEIITEIIGLVRDVEGRDTDIEPDTSLIHEEQERWRQQEERLRKLREQVEDLEQQRDSLQRAQDALGDSLKRTRDTLQLLQRTRDDQVGQLVERVLRLKDDSLALENIIPEAIQLLAVNFERDEKKVLDADTTILVFIGGLLRDYRDLRVEVIGHADERGTKDTNQLLSEARADTVKNYLVRKFGIDSTRIETRGRGEEDAVPARGNPTLLAKNRRVEFRILAGIRQ